MENLEGLLIGVIKKEAPFIAFVRKRKNKVQISSFLEGPDSKNNEMYISFWKPGLKKEKPMMKRTRMIRALCEFKGVLYESLRGMNAIINVFETKGEKIFLSITQSEPFALQVYKSRVYSAGKHEILSPGYPPYFNTQRSNVMCLGIYQGKLYDGGREGLFETHSNKLIHKKGALVRGICEHKGKMFDIRDYDDKIGSGVFDTEANKEIFGHDSIIWAISPYKNKLYASINGGIIDVERGNKVLDTNGAPVTCMAPISKKLYQRINKL
jgi:hypothetical protein